MCSVPVGIGYMAGRSDFLGALAARLDRSAKTHAQGHTP